MNNDQEIILAKISAVYDKPPFVKMETGQMEMILKCVGLGAYYDKYREYLEPIPAQVPFLLFRKVINLQKPITEIGLAAMMKAMR